MNRITLQQIEELPVEERTSLKAYCNEQLGQMMAKRKRLKGIAIAIARSECEEEDPYHDE